MKAIDGSENRRGLSRMRVIIAERMRDRSILRPRRINHARCANARLFVAHPLRVSFPFRFWPRGRAIRRSRRSEVSEKVFREEGRSFAFSYSSPLDGIPALQGIGKIVRLAPSTLLGSMYPIDHHPKSIRFYNSCDWFHGCPITIDTAIFHGDP